MARATRVEVGFELEDVALRVVCEVGPYEPGVMWGDNACPADPGEVEIVEVFEEDSGIARPDLIDVLSAREPFARIEDLAHEDAAEAARDAEYERAEHQSEMRRERRWEG